MAGGTVYPLAIIDEICAYAHARKLKVHVDGARIFNASAALGISVARIAEGVDSVMFCLSKGLGAPVGSMFASTAEAVARGRLLRKRLGGGMRQAGVLAAAGLIALDDSPRLLMKDHANARFLAEQLSSIPGISIDPNKVQTNIAIFDVSGLGLNANQLSSLLKARGVLANPIGPTHLRLVTHSDVSRPQCQRAIEILSHIAQETAAGAMI
jgi:threonine aldolase